MPLQLQFVAVSNPTGPVPSESRKLCHSHATRQTHAKERRLRVQRYQKEVTQFRLEGNHDLNTLGPLGRTHNHGNDPFAAIARPLSSQEYFLLDYYIRIVVPHSAVHCGLFDYQGDHLRRILRDWVGLAITDEDFLDSGILLSACQNLLRSNPGDPVLTRMALQYKQRGLQTLRRALGEPVSILTVAVALSLALDEVRLGTREIYLGSLD
ncbi:hypothetical protein AUP68_04199 [Ilyonectria robusta]